MKAEIIAVGNEIIAGNTINTNASYIARQIQTIGIMPYYQSVVRDHEEDIERAVEQALKRSDFIFITGGLGPTKDDLTKETVCKYLNRPLEINKASLEEIEAHFKRIQKPMPVINRKQAAFPKDAYILKNSRGTAPGCILKKDQAYIVLLPGPPKELIPMVEESVLPYLKTKSNACCHTIDIKLFGIGESAVAEKINHLLGDFENINVAPFVGPNEVIVRITGQSSSQEQVVKYTENIKNKICGCLEEYIIGYNQESLENNILKLLEKHHYSVATVESCTGGMLAAALVNCSGISSYFNEGVITYSNDAKKDYVGVKDETLRMYGAVSEQTAREMAQGISSRAKSSIGLSTTGIAGPEGGTADKPVGLVYVGITLQDKTYVHELHLSGTRQEIREKTVKNTLFQLYKYLRQI